MEIPARSISEKYDRPGSFAREPDANGRLLDPAPNLSITQNFVSPAHACKPLLFTLDRLLLLRVAGRWFALAYV